MTTRNGAGGGTCDCCAIKGSTGAVSPRFAIQQPHRAVVLYAQRPPGFKPPTRTKKAAPDDTLPYGIAYGLAPQASPAFTPSLRAASATGGARRLFKSSDKKTNEKGIRWMPFSLASADLLDATQFLRKMAFYMG